MMGTCCDIRIFYIPVPHIDTGQSCYISTVPSFPSYLLTYKVHTTVHTDNVLYIIMYVQYIQYRQYVQYVQYRQTDSTDINRNEGKSPPPVVHSSPGGWLRSWIFSLDCTLIGSTTRRQPLDPADPAHRNRNRSRNRQTLPLSPSPCHRIFVSATSVLLPAPVGYVMYSTYLRLLASYL